RLMAISSMHNVKLGIISFDSAGLNLRQPQEIELYSRIFEQHAAVASYGATARAIIGQEPRCNSPSPAGRDRPVQRWPVLRRCSESGQSHEGDQLDDTASSAALTSLRNLACTHVFSSPALTRLQIPFVGQSRVSRGSRRNTLVGFVPLNVAARTTTAWSVTAMMRRFTMDWPRSPNELPIQGFTPACARNTCCTCSPGSTG